MKVIAILEVDPDAVLDAANMGDPDRSLNLGEAVEHEINGWLQGTIVARVIIEPDEVPPNDADLGQLIRSL